MQFLFKIEIAENLKVVEFSKAKNDKKSTSNLKTYRREDLIYTRARPVIDLLTAAQTTSNNASRQGRSCCPSAKREQYLSTFLKSTGVTRWA